MANILAGPGFASAVGADDDQTIEGTKPTQGGTPLPNAPLSEDHMNRVMQLGINPSDFRTKVPAHQRDEVLGYVESQKKKQPVTPDDSDDTAPRFQKTATLAGIN